MSELAAHRSLESLPGPRGWPLLGNFPQIDFSQFHTQLERWADEHGPFYQISIGPSRFLVTYDVNAAQTLLRERPALFSRRERLEQVFAELGFNGVFSADGDNWRRQRKIVITALNSAHLHSFYAAMRATTERLERRWRAAADTGAVVDLTADLMRYTVDITTQLAFGIDFNTLETDGPVIQQHLDKVFPGLNRRLASPIPYWRLVRLAQDRELDHAVQSVQAQIKDIIAACRQRLAVQPDLRAAPSNFLEAMIVAQEAEQLPFSDADIIANVFTLLLAGEDTTANTLAWAMKLFIDHPDLLGRVRAEVDALLGSHTIPPDHVTAGQQPLIEAFANETMRLKPVAPIIIFEAKAATVLQDVALPAGTGIVLLSRQMATQPEHFAQPQTFSMDRWLARGEAERGAHNPRAFVPFGGGPRFCPGRNLALLEIKVVLAMFCRNFELALANPAQSVAEAFAFTMGPENLQVRFQRRA